MVTIEIRNEEGAVMEVSEISDLDVDNRANELPEGWVLSILSSSDGEIGPERDERPRWANLFSGCSICGQIECGHADYDDVDSETWFALSNPNTGEMFVSAGETRGWRSRTEAQVYLDNWDLGEGVEIVGFDVAHARWQEANGIEMSICPEHGDQNVVRHSSTEGSDPYDVEHLACGHRVIWMDKDDVHII